jgi:hypothetical protein
VTLLHNFHIAQSIIVKVKVYALQEVRTFLDQLPKSNNSGEQQRHEHDNREKNCERDCIRRNSGDTDLFELQFQISVRENVYTSTVIDVQSCPKFIVFIRRNQRRRP